MKHINRKILQIIILIFSLIVVIWLFSDYKYFFSNQVKDARKANHVEKMVYLNDYVGVKKWINNDGDPNYISTNGLSLLNIATGPKGGIDVLKVLIENGANIDQKSYEYTPLMNAASWCNLDMVEFLLKNGADPNIENEKGEKASEIFFEGNKSKEIRDVLKRHEK